MSRLWFCLALVAAGCLPDAEARPGAGHRQSRRSSPNHKSGSVSYTGVATYGRTWDLAFDGRNCVNGAFNTWSDQTALGVNMALDATDNDYSCDYSTAGLTEAGIGTALVNNGVRVAQTTAGCWGDATPSGFPTIGDADNFVVRMIFRANVAPTVAAGLYEWNPGGSEFHELNYLSGDQLRFDVDEAGGTEYVGVQTAAVSAGAWHFVDMFYDAVGTTNPVTTICLDGTCTAQTEHTGLHGVFGPSGTFNLGGDGGCVANAPDTSILFLGYAIGANAAFWAEATHDSDCQSTGVCP